MGTEMRIGEGYFQCFEPAISNNHHMAKIRQYQGNEIVLDMEA